MSLCTKGRINPNPQTKLRLFADSGGYCNRPTCRRPLFSDLSSEADYHIGEMAHIIAANDDGPRSDKALSDEERARYENLIILCPSCHTEIDKAPQIFPVEMIREWKANHQKILAENLGIARMDNRPDARKYVLNLLRRNKTIFETLNPNLPYHENPEAEEALVWQRKMVTQIIPNNQEILLFLDTNSHLLKTEEQTILELFRQHINDLIEKHLGEKGTIASRFPQKIENILEG